MTESDEQLMALALAAQANAYAPYSHFRVGSALRSGGRVFSGANVENASYGLALCAERAAVARAVFDGVRTIEVIAVATDATPPAPPCGMCLQTLAEFSPDLGKTRVLLGNSAGARHELTLEELLPYGFRPSDLEHAQKKG